MDKFESRVLIGTGAFLVVLIFALLLSLRSGAGEIPDCIPFDEGYLEPRVVEIDDSTFQVFMLAQMWSFDPNEIYLPVGAEVDFYLTSKDVVHGFHINDVAANLMAVYGSVSKITVKFNKPGIYPIVCHEYCGSGHQQMRGEVIVNYPN